MDIISTFSCPRNCCEKIFFTVAFPFMIANLAVGFVIQKVVITCLRIFELLSKDNPPFSPPRRIEVRVPLKLSFEMISRFMRGTELRLNNDVFCFNQDLLHSHLKSYLNLKRYKELFVFGEGPPLFEPYEIEKFEKFLSNETFHRSFCHWSSIPYKSYAFLSKILDALLQLKKRALENPDYEDSYKELVKNALSDLVHRNCTDQTLIRAETVLLQVSVELLEANNIAVICKSILSQYQKDLLLEITRRLYPHEYHQADLFQAILRAFNTRQRNPVASRNIGSLWNVVSDLEIKQICILETFETEYRPIDFLLESLKNSYASSLPAVKKLFSLIGPWFEKTVEGFDFDIREHAHALMPEENWESYPEEGHDFFMHNGAFNKGAIAFFLYHTGIIAL